MPLELAVTAPTHTGLAIYPAGATFGPRKMRDFEFVWIIEGDVEYRSNTLTLSAPSGSIVLCRRDTVDFFRWDPLKRTRHGFFHFDLAEYPSHWPAERDWPLVRMPPPGDILRPLFRQIMAWAGKGDALQVKLSVANMLAAFISGEIGARELPQEPLPAAVERALRHIDRRLNEATDAHIELAELAHAACVTPEHLCRLFKTALQYSPVETVRLARLDRAVIFLARSNYTIGEIARLCGFASQFHFSRRFREAFGKAPRQLRAELQAGAIPPTSRLLRIAPSLLKTHNRAPGA